MYKISTALIALGACVQAASAETYSVDVWADNWFAFHINGELVAEDSVSITTERSFNKESFSFDAEQPFVVGVIAKDFKENDTGLEYIGTKRQQMGDGGLILQIKDSAGAVVAVSNGDWACLVTHTAPLNKSCEKASDPVAGEGDCGFSETAEPDGWDVAGFDASGWSSASVFSEGDVDPKLGYDEVNWDNSAELIWGPDLETNNSVLCRLDVN